MITSSKELGKHIATLRKKKGLSQIELAKLSDMPVISIRRCEQSGAIPLKRYVALVTLLEARVEILESPMMNHKSNQRNIEETIQSREKANQTDLYFSALAYKLGTVPHISLLLRKLAKHGLKTPEEMAACAVDRGCRHYANMPKWKDIKPLRAPEISNEELAMGLLSPCHSYEPLFIRVGCQLLSAPQSNPKVLAHLADRERSLPILKYIATCGKETEPDNPFWSEILDSLPKSEHPYPEFPKNSIHISRFRAETGITNPFKPNMPKTVWLRPHTV